MIRARVPFTLLLTAALLLLACLAAHPAAKENAKSPYFRAGLYLDWYGAQYEGIELSSRFSLRLKGEFLNRRGQGWNLLIDLRDRLRADEVGGNKVLLYNARMSFEKTGSPFYVSLGQMNLYDTAGIGQLLGGVLGFKPVSGLLVGGYAGLESSVYIDRVSGDYNKFGFFARWLGERGKQASLSFNQVRYSGGVERSYLFAGTLFPLSRSLVLYGNAEVELAPQVSSADRLTRTFANVRWDPAEWLDLMAHYSSGRGMDFHGYMIERSQNPTLNDQDLERFYYTRQYGLRMSLKPRRGMRFYVERRESEQKDQEVRNHTWRLGTSVNNLLKTGIALYGNYALRRGEISEADSYYISLTRNIGRVSLNVSYSNTFNGVRFDYRTGVPELLHLDDYKTISTHVFVPVTRMVAVSAEYEYFLQKEADQHLFFVRLILRN